MKGDKKNGRNGWIPGGMDILGRIIYKKNPHKASPGETGTILDVLKNEIPHDLRPPKRSSMLKDRGESIKEFVSKHPHAMFHVLTQQVLSEKNYSIKDENGNQVGMRAADGEVYVREKSGKFTRVPSSTFGAISVEGFSAVMKDIYGDEITHKDSLEHVCIDSEGNIHVGVQGRGEGEDFVLRRRIDPQDGTPYFTVEDEAKEYKFVESEDGGKEKPIRIDARDVGVCVNELAKLYSSRPDVAGYVKDSVKEGVFMSPSFVSAARRHKRRLDKAGGHDYLYHAGGGFLVNIFEKASLHGGW